MRIKKILGLVILLIMAAAAIMFYYYKPIELSIDSLRDLLDGNRIAYIIFLGIWVLRLVIFIPGVTLLVLGGIIFKPVEALMLSLIGLILSDSIVFLLGRSGIFEGIKKSIKEKYGYIYKLMEEYNYKILAIGILCPIAPSDVICYLASYLGITYKKFISIFTLSNIPAAAMYSFLGGSIDKSIVKILLIGASLIITSIITIREWHKLKLSISER